jgi:putative addiction module component (TIGR02574 family)
MSVANEILNRALELPNTERAAIAHRLLLSLKPEDFDPDSESAWAEEIDSRLKRIDRGEYSASDWRDAVARIRQSCPEEQNREGEDSRGSRNRGTRGGALGL